MKYEVLKYGEVDSNIVAQFDKILISPGPGIPEDFPNLEKWVVEFGNKKSFLGICLGHEAIALAYGAKLRKLEGVFHGVAKKTVITRPDDYIFRDVPVEFYGGLYHSWALDESSFPGELEITSGSEDGIIMSFTHKMFDCKGLQFHPESNMTKVGERIMRNWLLHI